MGDEKRPAGLVKKLSEVMAEVSRLPKSGYNERQNYHYVTESDVMDCIRSNLASRGVVITHETMAFNPDWRESKSGGSIQFVTVCLQFTAHDTDGASLDLGKGYGMGQDSGEKAVYKAITGAVKYKLLKTFLMSSGDDPEAEKKPIHAERRPQQQREAKPAASAAPQGHASAPTTFPKFGKASGQPIHGASMKDLEFYAGAIRKSIDDPEKQRFAASNRAMLAAIEAEISRQNGAPAGPIGATKPYAEAWGLAMAAGWKQESLGKWLAEHFKRGGSGEVTADDVAALKAHLAAGGTSSEPPIPF